MLHAFEVIPGRHTSHDTNGRHPSATEKGTHVQNSSSNRHICVVKEMIIPFENILQRFLIRHRLFTGMIEICCFLPGKLTVPTGDSDARVQASVCEAVQCLKHFLHTQRARGYQSPIS